MVCTNCGAQLPEDANFCEMCGTKVEKKRYCLSCGAELSQVAKFCMKCGTKVETDNNIDIVNNNQAKSNDSYVRFSGSPEKIAFRSEYYDGSIILNNSCMEGHFGYPERSIFAYNEANSSIYLLGGSHDFLDSAKPVIFVTDGKMIKKTILLGEESEGAEAIATNNQGIYVYKFNCNENNKKYDIILYSYEGVLRGQFSLQLPIDEHISYMYIYDDKIYYARSKTCAPELTYFQISHEIVEFNMITGSEREIWNFESIRDTLTQLIKKDMKDYAQEYDCEVIEDETLWRSLGEAVKLYINDTTALIYFYMYIVCGDYDKNIEKAFSIHLNGLEFEEIPLKNRLGFEMHYIDMCTGDIWYRESHGDDKLYKTSYDKFVQNIKANEEMRDFGSGNLTKSSLYFDGQSAFLADYSDVFMIDRNGNKIKCSDSDRKRHVFYKLGPYVYTDLTDADDCDYDDQTLLDVYFCQSNTKLEKKVFQLSAKEFRDAYETKLAEVDGNIKVETDNNIDIANNNQAKSNVPYVRFSGSPEKIAFRSEYYYGGIVDSISSLGHTGYPVRKIFAYNEENSSIYLLGGSDEFLSVKPVIFETDGKTIKKTILLGKEAEGVAAIATNNQGIYVYKRKDKEIVDHGITNINGIILYSHDGDWLGQFSFQLPEDEQISYMYIYDDKIYYARCKEFVMGGLPYSQISHRFFEYDMITGSEREIWNFESIRDTFTQQIKKDMRDYAKQYYGYCDETIEDETLWRSFDEGVRLYVNDTTAFIYLKIYSKLNIEEPEGAFYRTTIAKAFSIQLNGLEFEEIPLENQLGFEMHYIDMCTGNIWYRKNHYDDKLYKTSYDKFVQNIEANEEMWNFSPVNFEKDILSYFDGQSAFISNYDDVSEIYRNGNKIKCSDSDRVRNVLYKLGPYVYADLTHDDYLQYDDQNLSNFYFDEANIKLEKVFQLSAKDFENAYETKLAEVNGNM